MHPTHGARMQLTLQAQDDASVSYGVKLFGPEQVWEGRARVALSDGSVGFDGWRGDEPPPEWTIKMTAAFLKQTWRSRQKPDSPAWPRKVARWRASPT